MAKAWKSIRIDRPFPLPTYVKESLQRLYDSGHVAYIVGGSVRDFLLGRETKDHDIATSANPDELCQIFPNAITVGKAFGVIKVPAGDRGELLEIATFRKDLEYTDFRHPVKVMFTDAAGDASRRDFTVNALFYDPKTQQILDSTGGLEDIKSRVIRAIGDADERFREDALRLLRAIRFKTTLGFELFSSTAHAVKTKARLISKVSSERIRDELSLMWMGPRPDEALKTLSQLNLLSHCLPEIEAVHASSDVWKHLLKMLNYLARKNPKRSLTLSWAAVLYSVGKPMALILNKDKNFNGHEIQAALLAKDISQRLKMSRVESDRIAAMVGDQLKFKEVFQMRESTLQRFIRKEYFEELLALHEADAATSDGNLAFFEFCSSRLEVFKRASPFDSAKLVDGKDLIQLGFVPGPEFSEILTVVEDLALEKKLSSKEEALEFVIRNFVK